MQQLYKHPSASRNFCVDFSKQLATGAVSPETLSGSPTVTQVSPPDAALTIASSAVNSAIVYPPNGETTVAANQGVTFQCSGGTNGNAYTLRVSCATSTGNTLAVDAVVNVGTGY
jgi:hypothetical protein